MGLFDTFVPEKYYHIFSRTNNKEMMFRSLENRRYFLNRISVYLCPYLYIHAYALLGNHYHLLVEVRPEADIINKIKEVEEEKRTKAMARILEIDTCLVSKTSQVSISNRIDEFIIHQFQRLSISYTKALNKQIGRQGHLFNRPFKRSLLDFEQRYMYMVYYIHHNARKHGFVSDFLEYPHHSYSEIVNQDSTIIDYDRILANFGGKERFIAFHSESHYEDLFEGLVIEQEW